MHHGKAKGSEVTNTLPKDDDRLGEPGQWSLPELHGHGGVGHPCPPQPASLHAVLGLVLEVDVAYSGTVLPEDVGHLWRPRVGDKVAAGCHSLLSLLPLPKVLGKNTCAGRTWQGISPEPNGQGDLSHWSEGPRGAGQ